MLQRSEEWYAERCGKVTASRISDMLARTKSGWGASRGNYLAELVAERLTGQPSQGFRPTAAIQWGIDHEDMARAAYEAHHAVLVEEVGFVTHPDIPESGASPDGLVGDTGLVEIKCPNTATHIDTLLKHSVPQKYQLQMQWQMACTERDYCDFVSFDPRMPEHMQLWVRTIERDNDQIESMTAEVEDFLGELHTKVDTLRKEYG